MKEYEYESMDNRIRRRTINPPMTVRVKPRILATLHRWLYQELPEPIKTRSEIVVITLEAVVEDLIKQGVEPFFSDEEALKYMAGRGIDFRTSKRGQKAVASIQRSRENTRVGREFGLSDEQQYLVHNHGADPEMFTQPTEEVGKGGGFDPDADRRYLEKLKQESLASHKFRKESELNKQEDDDESA